MFFSWPTSGDSSRREGRTIPTPLNCERFKAAIGPDLRGSPQMKTFPIFFRQLPRKTSQWNCFFFFFFFSLLLFFPALRFCSVSAYFRMRVAVRRAIVFPGNLLWRNVPCNKFYRRLAFKLSGVLPFLLLNRHPILYIMHIRLPEVRLESCCRYTLIVAEIVEKFSRIRYYIWVLNWKFYSLNFRVNFRIIILFYLNHYLNYAATYITN